MTLKIYTLSLANENAREQSLSNEQFSWLFRLLSGDEQLRAKRFLHQRDTTRFVIAHSFLRARLGNELGLPPQHITIKKEAQGRPYIESSQNKQHIDFNLSHTTGMVGCAIGKHVRLGFDVEPMSRSVDATAVAKKKFSVFEQNQLKGLTDAEVNKKFLQFWTLKETYIKLSGLGLRESLQSFAFDLSKDKVTCTNEGGANLESSYFSLNINNTHWAALAVSSSNKEKNERLEVNNMKLSEFVGRMGQA